MKRRFLLAFFCMFFMTGVCMAKETATKNKATSGKQQGEALNGASSSDTVMELAGYRISVRETGSGPDMVVLHGRNYSKEMMTAVVEHYRSRFHVVTYDALGHGESDKPKEITLEAQSDVLKALVEKLGLKNPVAVGFSMGSYITLTAAERFPGIFSRMVLIGTRGLSETGSGGKIFAPNTTMEQIIAFDRAIASKVKLTDGDKENIGKSLANFDLLKDAKKADIPALVLTGHYDGLNSPAEGKRVVDALPKAEFHEIPDAGHIAFFENPGRVFELMDNFLKR